MSDTTPQNLSPRYLRRDQAAKYMGCSLRQLDEFKHEGALPFHRLGRRLVVFRVDDLEAFMNKSRVVPPGAQKQTVCGGTAVWATENRSSSARNSQQGDAITASPHECARVADRSFPL